MTQRYKLVFITNLPSFYKINLYNEINKKVPVFVIFTGDIVQEREKDFFNGEINFDHLCLPGNSKLKRLFKLIKILSKLKYSELVLGGWDSFLFWVSIFLSPKRKNSVAIESSYHESSMSGIKGLLKKIFMKRISRVYASGVSQMKLAKNMGYNGNNIIITKGVGVFNYIEQPEYKEKSVVKNFVYVGRLSEEKNLRLLISVFNRLPMMNLNIIGYGHMKDELVTIAKNNVFFIGSVDNKQLPKYYQQNDVFILPSISEPWGLVVEEALNNGLPVILSNRVGCAEEILIENENGLSFQYDNEDSLFEAIRQMADIVTYNRMAKNISKMNFRLIEDKQINSYIH